MYLFFLFCCLCFCYCISKKSLPNPTKIYYMFSSMYSLALTFVFVFWVIFAYHIRSRSRSILLHVDICLNTICWKKWILPLLNCLGSPLKKINGHRCMGLFLDYQKLYSIDLFMSLSHCFEFCHKFQNQVWLLRFVVFLHYFSYFDSLTIPVI